MPKLVEDAGGELSAGHFNKLYRFRWNSTGSNVLAGQSVDRVRERKGLEVTHQVLQGSTERVSYTVQPWVRFFRLVAIVRGGSARAVASESIRCICRLAGNGLAVGVAVA